MAKRLIKRNVNDPNVLADASWDGKIIPSGMTVDVIDSEGVLISRKTGDGVLTFNELPWDDDGIIKDYYTTALLYANQSTQIPGKQYRVITGSGYPGVSTGYVILVYKGTTNGDDTDYYIHSKEEALTTTAFGETTQSLTVTNANKASSLALNTDTLILDITLDATMDGDWNPSSITGFQKGRQIKMMVTQNSTYKINFASAISGGNIELANGIDLFGNLDDFQSSGEILIFYIEGISTTRGRVIDNVILPD